MENAWTYMEIVLPSKLCYVGLLYCTKAWYAFLLGGTDKPSPPYVANVRSGGLADE